MSPTASAPTEFRQEVERTVNQRVGATQEMTHLSERRLDDLRGVSIKPPFQTLMIGSVAAARAVPLKRLTALSPNV